MSVTSIRESSLWKEFVSGGQPKLKTDVRDALATSVTGEQLAELIEMTASESTLDAEAAIRVLMQVPRDRVSGPQRDSWGADLLEVVRKHYPRNSLGIVAYSALRDVSREAAGRFLLSELDYDGIRESDMRWVISALQVNGSGEALARLETLAPYHDEARKAAEQVAGPSRAALERLAEDWRQTHRSSVLDELWWKHITRLREGASAKALTALLGEPTDRDGTRYWYRAADSDTTLFLEADDRDRLVSWKLG